MEKLRNKRRCTLHSRVAKTKLITGNKGNENKLHSNMCSLTK
uniref:Uncharacterized protein n=1 Tax=Anguilla anguilla TaxID=7936 RepID=A0A0E9RU56_ANGAN